MKIISPLILVLCLAIFASAQALTTQTVRDSLRGQMIMVPNYQETTPIDWTFEESELLEVDIISTEKSELSLKAVVQIRTSEAANKINFADVQGERKYFPSPMLEGKLQLKFAIRSGNYELKAVDNLSVKYRLLQPEVTDQTANYKSQLETPTNETTPTSEMFPIVNDTFHVKGKGWQPIYFRLVKPTRITGSFFAAGGSRNSIEAILLTEREYINWTNSNRYHFFYKSGLVTTGTIDTVLSPDRYVLVFYNSDLLTGKTVSAKVFGQ